MPRTVPGRASYSASRAAGITTLIAVGETPNFNDKVDFVQRPELIFPPSFSFVFIHADIGLPAMKPFKYEEIIAFPPDADSVLVIDADGPHAVAISELPTAPAHVASVADDGTASYCVFEWIGINRHIIAKCDAAVPAVFQRAFGPDTYPACKAYVERNGGI
jgi:hypothetical protein